MKVEGVVETTVGTHVPLRHLRRLVLINTPHRYWWLHHVLRWTLAHELVHVLVLPLTGVAHVPGMEVTLVVHLQFLLVNEASGTWNSFSLVDAPEIYHASVKIIVQLPNASTCSLATIKPTLTLCQHLRRLHEAWAKAAVARAGLALWSLHALVLVLLQEHHELL